MSFIITFHICILYPLIIFTLPLASLAFPLVIFLSEIASLFFHDCLKESRFCIGEETCDIYFSESGLHHVA